MPVKDDQNFRVAYVENAIVTGKRFKARLIEPGIISYEDVKQGKALLKKPTIDRCINSFVGNPITLKHKRVTSENAADEASKNGVIESVSYNSEDGWYWCEGSVNGQDARNRINSVGRVSCGYAITSQGPRGVHHCIPYDYEITGFIGEHLAIEEKPRYEDATIRLNAKQHQPTGNIMFKWFKPKPAQENAQPDQAAIDEQKRKDAEAETARLNAIAAASAAQPEDVSGDTEILVGEGEKAAKVKLSDIIAGYSAHVTNSVATGGELPADASVEVDGAPVSIADLVESHKARLNSIKEAKANEGKRFLRIVSAATRHEAQPKAEPANLETQETRLERGKQHY